MSGHNSVIEPAVIVCFLVILVIAQQLSFFWFTWLFFRFYQFSPISWKIQKSYNIFQNHKGGVISLNKLVISHDPRIITTYCSLNHVMVTY